MEDPERLVTGARPDVGGQVRARGEGLAQGLGQKDSGGRDPDAGHGWSGPGKRGWATRQGLHLGGDVGPLGVQGDELARQVRQDDASGVGAGDNNRLPGERVDDVLGPRGVAPAPVGLELGIDPGSTIIAVLGLIISTHSCDFEKSFAGLIKYLI